MTFNDIRNELKVLAKQTKITAADQKRLFGWPLFKRKDVYYNEKTDEIEVTAYSGYGTVSNKMIISFHEIFALLAPQKLCIDCVIFKDLVGYKDKKIRTTLCQVRHKNKTK